MGLAQRSPHYVQGLGLQRLRQSLRCLEFGAFWNINMVIEASWR